jgi:hypothetical protein
MRKCTKCGETKAVVEFNLYKGKPRAYCKLCHRAASRHYRLNDTLYKEKKNKRERAKWEAERAVNPEVWRAKMRERYHKYKELGYKPQHKRDPVKHSCRNTTNYHIKKGNIMPSSSCEKCGATERLHAHHEDYTKVKEIIILCAACHKEVHKRVNVSAS